MSPTDQTVAPHAASAPAKLGVQLYSVKDYLTPDLLQGTLRRLAEMGFTHAEPYDILGYTDALADALAASGLRATTAHSKITELDRVAVVNAAKALGIDTVIVPWVQPASIATTDGVRALAAAINAAAEYAAAHGIRVGYHNHDFEFAQHVDDGRSAYEVLVEHLAPEIILELDSYWASVGGADVFELIPRLGDRVRLLHVKNEPPDDDDPPLLGVDITGRMREVVGLAGSLEMPVVEVVVDDGDVFPVLQRNAAFFADALAGTEAHA